MTDFRDEPIDDFCFTCGLPITKHQSYKYDGKVLSHQVCYDEDMRNKD